MTSIKLSGFIFNCSRITILLSLLFIFSACVRRINTKTVAHETLVHYYKDIYNNDKIDVRFDTLNFFYFKNYVICIHKEPFSYVLNNEIHTTKKNLITLLRKGDKFCYQFDTLYLSNNYKKISVYSFQNNGLIGEAYKYSDTSNFKFSVLKSNRRKKIVSVLDKKYNSTSKIYFLKRKSYLQSSIAPFLDSIYHQKAYKFLYKKEFTDSSNTRNKIPIQTYIERKIDKIRISKKDIENIKKFLQDCEDSIYK